MVGWLENDCRALEQGIFCARRFWEGGRVQGRGTRVPGQRGLGHRHGSARLVLFRARAGVGADQWTRPSPLYDILANKALASRYLFGGGLDVGGFASLYARARLRRSVAEVESFRREASAMWIRRPLPQATAVQRNPERRGGESVWATRNRSDARFEPFLCETHLRWRDESKRGRLVNGEARQCSHEFA